jgi:hypothetical protein
MMDNIDLQAIERIQQAAYESTTGLLKEPFRLFFMIVPPCILSPLPKMNSSSTV